MSEPTEPTEKINLKTKKIRTPEQLEVLAKAREKALQIRKENAKLRQAEKQIEKDKKAKELMARKQKVKEYLEPVPDPEPVEPEPPKEIKRIPKVPVQRTVPKKEKKKKIKYVEVEESSESEEEEIVYVKKSKPKERTVAPKERVDPKVPTKGQENYKKLMESTFGKSRHFI